MQQQLLYKIALTQIPNIGPVLAKNLLSYCGSAEAVFKEKPQKLLKIPGIGKTHVSKIISFTNFEKAQEELTYIEQNNIQLLFFSDAMYPARLKQIADAPIVLYSKGNAHYNTSRMLGIVGTRNASPYGKEICTQIVKELQEYNCTIVSGLAHGIDVAAHKAAIQYGLQTVGVLAHGIDKLYPIENKATAQKMLENGGLLTEYTTGTNPDRENFPTRNRIVAGICDALLVVETDLKGGSMITADIAHSYNRDVFAVPGAPAAQKSKGCNWLIKTNKAALIESAKDIADMMGWEKQEKGNLVKEIALPKELSPNETRIAQTLQIAPLGIDEITNTTNLTASEVSLTLLEMEMKGWVKSLPGKVYKLSL